MPNQTDGSEGKVPFTKKQFETLLKLVHLGNFVVNSFRPHKEKLKEYEKLEQHVLSFAKDFGLERRVKEDKNGYFLSETLEDEAHMHSKRYDDDVFWDTLVLHLAKRDLREEHGKKELDGLDDDEYLKLLDVAEEKYEKEFDARGIDRLRIDLE